MFLPATRSECARLGWDSLDIIFVTGDSYIDSPFTGIAVLGKLLVREGFRVGVIAQPDTGTVDDIARLGEPLLFWGITSGAVDSMVANYTALKKRRKSDDYTPGGMNTRRPDRAVIAYTNLVKRYFKQTVPIVLGGIEASLRRIGHYDFWSDAVRRSILVDAKADLLVYGMAETTVLDLARALKERRDVSGIRGLCWMSPRPVDGYVELPSFDEIAADAGKFITSFHLFYANTDPLTATGLVQKQDSRYLVHNPPAPALSVEAMDRVYDLEFERDLHPLCARAGAVKALDTIRFSVATHRGCYGECHFCAIAVHEGRTVQWRSLESIVREVTAMTSHPLFKGIISDAGGPTANMYGYECRKKLATGACADKRCLFPSVCRSLGPDHLPQMRLLDAIRKINGVRKVFVASGIRPDLIEADKTHGIQYLEQIVRHHVSGQLKLAPEHSSPRVLKAMGKPGPESLEAFKDRFDALSQAVGSRQFLTYYLMAAHPGCTQADMDSLKQFCRATLRISPEQVQIFTPTPSTYSTLMYCTGKDPFTRNPVYVEKHPAGKERQKAAITPAGQARNRVRNKGKKNR